jgi:hypothetical protein
MEGVFKSTGVSLEPSHLTRPYDNLPESLRHLHISALDNVMTNPHREINLILRAARTLNLDTVEVSLIMENWEGDSGYDCGVIELSSAVRQPYRNDVADMAANGITMRVWRESIASRLPPCLLFAPGFGRPWPQ